MFKLLFVHCFFSQLGTHPSSALYQTRELNTQSWPLFIVGCEKYKYIYGFGLRLSGVYAAAYIV